jgi:LemA protein
LAQRYLPDAARDPAASRWLPRRHLVRPVATSMLAACAVLVALAPSAAADVGAQNVALSLNDPGAVGAMNRSLTNILGLALLGLPLVASLVWLAWIYNSLIEKEEGVRGAWAQVESNYQRRSDLIPRLVQAVSRYMEHERETLEAVTGQRAAGINPIGDALERIVEAEREAGAVTRETAGAEAEALLRRLAQAQQALDRSLGHLFALAESYPDLRSADQFLELQAQLEGAENRINVARLEFNRAVETYNGAIGKLPASLIAGLGNFTRKAYFEAGENADQAGELQFGFAPGSPR